MLVRCLAMLMDSMKAWERGTSMELWTALPSETWMACTMVFLKVYQTENVKDFLKAPEMEVMKVYLKEKVMEYQRDDRKARKKERRWDGIAETNWACRCWLGIQRASKTGPLSMPQTAEGLEVKDIAS